MVQLQIQLTEKELQHLHNLAHDNGFESAEAYVKFMALQPSREELLDDIRDGLMSIKRGEPMLTLDELWAALEDDEDDDDGR